MPEEQGDGMRAAIITNDEAALRKSVQWIIDCGAEMVYSGHGRPCTIQEFTAAWEEDWNNP